MTFINEYRHHIVEMDRLLREQLRARAVRAMNRGCFDPLLDALEADPVWLPIARTLDRYGDKGRFFYLDALAGATPKDDSPEGYWEAVYNAARDADPELTRLFHAYAKDFSLHDTYMTGLNTAAADSLQRWWAMVAMAGKQGLMGERGVGVGLDQETIGRQVVASTL